MFPVAVGLGLSEYYQLGGFGDTAPTNHILGYASFGVLFDIVPRFTPSTARQLQYPAVARGVAAHAANDAQPHVNTVEFVAKIDSIAAFLIARARPARSGEGRSPSAA